MGDANEIKMLYKAYLRAGKKSVKNYFADLPSKIHYDNHYACGTFPRFDDKKLYGIVFIDQPCEDEYGDDDDKTWFLINSDNIARLLTM